ncbi:MAG: N-acetylmuramoyl-L-alanine amidase [bacterium]|nr:N-acetylmuramoyl-L-alanine amidase [bacterium]
MKTKSSFPPPHAIFVESGHRKTWLGTTGAKGNGIDEREYCVRLASAVMGILADKPAMKDVRIQGVGVSTSKTLTQKEDYINWLIHENGYDPKRCYSVSLHLNSFSQPQPSGFEIYYKHNNKVAYQMAAMVRESFRKYRIVSERKNSLLDAKNKNAGYINNYWANSILIECGFLSNPYDAKQMKENESRLAVCIAHGILNHFR